MPEFQQKVVFYLDEKNVEIFETFKYEIESLRKKNVLVTHHQRFEQKLPEVCINGYCVAGVDDIRYELKSLLS